LEVLAGGERPVTTWTGLKPIHDWVQRYEDSWTERFRQLDGVLEDLRRQERGAGGGGG
jgi:hypothetical protein